MSMRRGIAILGSTGSIGRSTLAVIALNEEAFLGDCLESVRDLVDEIVVHVAPILLGDGIPFYRGIQRDLTLLSTCREGDFLTLTLKPS